MVLFRLACLEINDSLGIAIFIVFDIIESALRAVRRVGGKVVPMCI